MTQYVFEFESPLDIANRACQRMGVRRIGGTIWPPTEDSVQATEIAFVYDKVRVAELRRNVWARATRRTVLRPVDDTTMLVVFPQWESTNEYDFGAVVQDSSGYLWVSLADENLGNAPGQSSQWDAYFGPLTATPYNTSLNETTTDDTTSPPVNSTWQNYQVAYYTGELVYEADGMGHQNVYVSTANNNNSDPGVPSAWSASITYTIGQVVQGSNSYFYKSTAQINLNNDPTLAPAPWDANSPYIATNLVGGEDGLIYYALEPSTGVQPVGDTTGTWQWMGKYAMWTSAFVDGTAANTWLQLNAALTPLKFAYPAGSGPSTDTSTRNVYWLPSGFLRHAPQDPKAGSTNYLGAPSNLAYEDWTWENKCFTSRFGWPIVFRFVANITQVSIMDPMFCEGLGARIGMEVVERVTQSAEKYRDCAMAYKTFMSEARIENGIETGPVEPPLDDYITCRL